MDEFNDLADMDIHLDDEDIEETEDKVESKKEDTPIHDFDLELLIVEGKDAIVERDVDFFNVKENQQETMTFRMKPVPHAEWVKAEGAMSKNKNKKTVRDFIGKIIANSLVDVNDESVPISIIRKLPGGTLKNLFEEAKIISGQFTDRTEDKLLEKIANL